MDVLYKRRSIRKYKPEPVLAEHLKELIKAGMAAPSANNLQPWEFVLMTDPTLFDEILSVHPHAMPLKSAGAGILVCSNLKRCNNSDYWVQDCSAATENILLQATAQGLGSCWLGVYPRKERIDKLKQLYKLPEYIVPFCVIAIGTPNEEKGTVDRYNEAWIHDNSW